VLYTTRLTHGYELVYSRCVKSFPWAFHFTHLANHSAGIFIGGKQSSPIYNKSRQYVRRNRTLFVQKLYDVAIGEGGLLFTKMFPAGVLPNSSLVISPEFFHNHSAANKANQSRDAINIALSDSNCVPAPSQTSRGVECCPVFIRLLLSLSPSYPISSAQS